VSHIREFPFGSLLIWKLGKIAAGANGKDTKRSIRFFYNGVFIKDIKFDYANSLKKELENIEI
jgi:hypothetical protein